MLAPRNPYQIDVVGLDQLGTSGWPGAREDSQWSLFAFQAHEFLDVWFKTIGAARGSEPLLVVLRDRRGDALLYLPLCLEMHRGVRVLRFPDGGVADYNAPIMRPDLSLGPAVFPAIWKTILAALPPADLVYLTKMPDRVVETPNPFLALELGSPDERGSFIDLKTPWTVYASDPARHAALGQGARKLRKLRRDHAVRFERAPQPQSSNWIDSILDHKRRQYLRTLGQDVIALPGYEAFFRRMAAPEQLGRISTLECLMVGDEMAAGHLGYTTATRTYVILTATNYDRFTKHSVGMSLFSHLLQQRCASENRVYDLGIGSEPYKELWATGRYDLYSYVRPLTVKGRLAAYALKLKHLRVGA